MKTSIRVTSYPRTVRAFCQEILKHRLHRQNGMMADWVCDPESVRCIAVAYNDKKVPVGAALLLKERCRISDTHIGVYVKAQLRRQGIGTLLVKKMLAHCGIHTEKQRARIVTWKLTAQSEGFYESVGFKN